MASSASLSAALEKLAQAVDTAEEALAAGAASDAGADVAQLESTLAELRRDHAGLKTVADDVTRRLDNAIEQVEAILSGRN